MTAYLIDFIDSATDVEISNYLTLNGCEIKTKFSHFKNIYHVSADVHPPLDHIVACITVDDAYGCTLLGGTPVPQFPPAGYFTVDPQNEKDWWKVYSLQDITLDSSSVTVPRFGNNVNLYLVDSGIDISHPEFLGRDITLLYSITGEFSDSTGHGTALSSVMIGNTCGMSNSSLKIVKLFDKTRTTLQSDILSAFNAILADALSSPNLVSVVNLSWSISKNQYVEQKIQTLINLGVAVVTASGNSGVPIEEVTPASMNDVFTIGSFSQNFIPSNFSNYSDSVVSLTKDAVNHGQLDAWAPGEQIWSATVGGGYGFGFGTSFSSAIYASSVAYNLSKGLTPELDVISSARTSTRQLIWSSITAADRIGILDLSDPKYSSSVNRICTYRNIESDSTKKMMTIPKVVSKVNDTQRAVIFLYNSTKSYEFMDPLPVGASVERNVLSFSPADEPSDPTGISEFFVNYSVTSIDSIVTNSQIHFVVLGKEFNKDILPPNDPMIKITQMAPDCPTNDKFGYQCSALFGCQTLTCGDTGPKGCRCS